ncbi:MAG: PEP-CTERM sorting domain-containing protein [Acidobacteria bacterium]|nr:PEP-CTERM sorting domain-containing protein [Acidobacteriota bacterium]
MRLRNRITRLAMMCLLVAPCAVRADVVYTHRLTSTPFFGSPNFFNGVTYNRTDFFADVDLGSGFDLTGAGGNLTLQLLAPVGKQIEIVTDVTVWRSALAVFAGGPQSSESSLAVSMTPGFVDLSNGTPTITSNGIFSRTDQNSGNLSNLRMGTLDGTFGNFVVQIAAGTRFSGISFTIPIAQLQANFPGFDLMFGLQSFGGSDPALVFNSEVQGDQTATMPSVVARYVDAADVPEPGTGMLVFAVLGICGLVRSRRGC